MEDNNKLNNIPKDGNNSFDFSDIPHEFLCPISKYPMIDPVVLLPYGHTYDKESIDKWLKQSNKCPLANKITNRVVVPNITIKKMINDECDRNEILKKYIVNERKERSERDNKYYKWQWYHFETDSWIDYDNVTRVRMEHAYRNNTHSNVCGLPINACYYINFNIMRQINVTSSIRQRRLRRVIVTEQDMKISPKWYYRVIKSPNSSKCTTIKVDENNDIKYFKLHDYAPMSLRDSDELNLAMIQKENNMYPYTVVCNGKIEINLAKMEQYNTMYPDRKRDIVIVE